MHAQVRSGPRETDRMGGACAVSLRYIAIAGASAPGGSGRLAVEDSSLGATLDRGRSPRLERVDRLLIFIGAEPVGPTFKREVDSFLEATGTKRSGRGPLVIPRS